MSYVTIAAAVWAYLIVVVFAVGVFRATLADPEDAVKVALIWPLTLPLLIGLAIKRVAVRAIKRIVGAIVGAGERVGDFINGALTGQRGERRPLFRWE